VAKIKPYHNPNPAAGTWNTALFAELRKLDVELHIVQFYAVFKLHTIREDNVTYYYLPRIPKIDSFTSLIKRFRVGRLASKIKPDLIHGIGSEHGHAWAAVQHRWPSVITIHGYLKHINRLEGHKSFLKELFLVREEKKALLSCDVVIAINEYMKDQFIRAGCPEEKIRIVPNALNPLFLSGCDSTVRDIDILMVGALHHLKNQHLALEIFAHMKTGYGKNPRVIIAGAPTAASKGYYDNLLSYKARNALDNVEFIGSVDQARLKALYCRSRILLHISEFEADPTVIAEALACEAVPAVNPVAGLAYRVKDNINGYYVNIRNLRQAAGKLVDILAQYSHAAMLAKYGKNLVLKERDPGNVARETLKGYSALLQTQKIY
jgi:glycosyltransferase involved in cell wall biosynthesis